MNEKIPSKLYYVPQKNYAVTINPIDQHQYLGKPLRLMLFKRFVKEQLEKLFSGTNTMCYFAIEISEPRGMRIQGFAGPRLHLHGILRFGNNYEVKEFLLKRYYALLRFAAVDIDEVKDKHIWLQYMRKQEKIVDTSTIRYGNIIKPLETGDKRKPFVEGENGEIARSVTETSET